MSNDAYFQCMAQLTDIAGCQFIKPEIKFDIL
jgi:hypothetical protein